MYSVVRAGLTREALGSVLNTTKRGKKERGGGKEEEKMLAVSFLPWMALL